MSTGQARERVLVIAPGRGTYNAGEWGYLQRHHAQRSSLLADFDAYRQTRNQPGLTELDANTPFKLSLHSRGDHASALIYACAYADALALDTERYEIVGVTGNSMGWYIALAVAEALDPMSGLHLVNSMGSLMQQSLIGGQLLQPWVDEQWRGQAQEWQRLEELMGRIHGDDGALLYPSIELGGMRVFGGNERGIKRLAESLPARDRFPMRLHNHAAFHTPLQAPVREQARPLLSDLPLGRPRVPLIDGTGRIWSPYSTDPHALWDYTLGEQLTAPYDFTTAIRVGVREFAPDRLVVLGPGSTLGGAVAQSLILANWRDLDCKAAFQTLQRDDPYLLSMGLPEQRQRLTSA